jgi:hypothetical protein
MHHILLYVIYNLQRANLVYLKKKTDHKPKTARMSKGTRETDNI